jgi:hypothetical protein
MSRDKAKYFPMMEQVARNHTQTRFRFVWVVCYLLTHTGCSFFTDLTYQAVKTQFTPADFPAVLAVKDFVQKLVRFPNEKYSKAAVGQDYDQTRLISYVKAFEAGTLNAMFRSEKPVDQDGTEAVTVVVGHEFQVMINYQGYHHVMNINVT